MTILLFTLLFASCKKGNEADNSVANPLQYSITEPFLVALPGHSNIRISTLISSEDTLVATPDFVFGATADGEGIVRSSNGDGFELLVNHEDNWAISRIHLDKQLKPISGEYVLNSNGAMTRLCSATMATPEEHGFGPQFLSAGETYGGVYVQGIDPLQAASPAVSKPLPGLGLWCAENAVPLPARAFPGRTVILIGEDAIDASGAQLVMYMSNQSGDLNGGKIYVLRQTDHNIRERDMKVGMSYPVEFVEIPAGATLSGAQVQQATMDSLAIRFAKLEDLDYRKGSSANNREVYFCGSGQAYATDNADSSRSHKGRIYKLQLNKNNPLEATLTCLLDGDDPISPAYHLFQNPDNICVTNNYAYICEDPVGYGDETHQAYLYHLHLPSNKLEPIIEVKKPAAYNTDGSPLSTFGNWEISGLIDISDISGRANTFTVGVQSHTWINSRFLNPDKGTITPFVNQGSQIVILEGLPR